MNVILNTRHFLTTAALVLALTPSLASADALPAPKRFGNVVYLSVGVTQNEAQAMRAVASQYNLRVAFIAHTSQYLADVPVSMVSPIDSEF